MALSKDDKDEIQELVAKEIRDVIKRASNAVINMPIELGEVHHATSPEGMKEREARKKIAQQVGKAISDVAEANLREAQARNIAKTDPERAKAVGGFDPTY